MKVTTTIDGANVTLVDIDINGLDIYATVLDNSTVKVIKYPRNHLQSATTIGTGAVSLENYVYGSNNTMDIAMASTNNNYASATPHYMYYNINQDCIISAANIVCLSFASQSLYTIGFYNYAITGAITKYNTGTGSVTLTASGVYNIPFTSAINLTRGRYFIGFMQVSGSATIMSRVTTPTSTGVSFTGTSGVSALPTSESSRTAITTLPYIEFY